MKPSTTKIASPDSTQYVAIQPEQPVLIVLAAGKGTRFGQEPKFPSPHNLLFLLRYWKRFDEPHALEMVELTLERMFRGGIQYGCG